MKPLLLALLFVFASSAAQAEPKLINTFRDWDAFTEGDGKDKVCFMASVPKKKNPSSVGHGNVYLTLAHKPRRAVQDEVNIVVGYKFRTGSNVKVDVGGRTERLFTVGSEAWAEHPDVDERLVKSMKKGAKMVASGTSSRGTSVSYEFSLYGFSAAYDAISSACGLM